LNLKEYISSGIVESYVLGLAGPQERAEFESLCLDHPEVRQAREAFEQLLEKQALEQSILPPANLKSKIVAEIEIEKDRGPKYARSKTSPKPVIKAGWVRYFAAASVLLLIGSTGLNFYFLSQYKKYITKYDELLALQGQTATANQALQTKLQDYDQAMRHIKDPVMAIVKLGGVAGSPSPHSMATVYWDTLSRDVYLLVNSLPQASQDMQYQLWAMVDGKPVDAGIFDNQEGFALVKMKNIPQAQAFAITLEKRGGSSSPSMDALYVMGKVSG
jgi:anti-sigma-K factor RskA